MLVGAVGIEVEIFQAVFSTEERKVDDGRQVDKIVVCTRQLDRLFRSVYVLFAQR